MLWFHIGKWVIGIPWWYLILVAALQFVIRAVMVALLCWELVYPPLGRNTNEREERRYDYQRDGFCKTWWQGFWCRHADAENCDFFHPTIIGLVELALYPPLIAHGSWAVIGGWIATKTAAKWPTWADRLTTYNRFLIGNAFVIAAACFLATFVAILP